MMTKEMLKDYIKVLKKKYKIVLIALIVVSLLFVGMTIFAFSEFEIETETETKYEFENEAKADGENAVITQNNTINEFHEFVVIAIIACSALVLMAIIITVGVVIYGKSKIKNYHYSSEKGDN